MLLEILVLKGVVVAATVLKGRYSETSANDANEVGICFVHDPGADTNHET